MHKMTRLRDTTAFQLSLRYAIGFCLLNLLAIVMVYQHTLNQIDTQINAGLRAELNSLTLGIEDSGLTELIQIVRKRSDISTIRTTNLGDAGPRFYLLVTADGHRLVGSMPKWRKALKQQGKLSLTTFELPIPANLRHFVENRKQVYLRSAQMVLPDGNRLLIAQSLNEQAELKTELWKLLIIVIVVMLSAGLLGGWWLGRNILRQLTEVIKTADTIMQGDLSKRIPESQFSAEFELLAQRLNRMLERIERLMNDLQETTINVAHDLRTPVTRLRSRAELALLQPDDADCRHALETTITQSDLLIQLLNGLLAISRVDSVQHQLEPVNLSALCQKAVDLYTPLAEDKALRLTAAIAPNVCVQGIAQLLSQALGNILDNAIKYTPNAGHIEVTLRQNADGIYLSVADTGPGIAAVDRERVKQRFTRLDASRHHPGHGLGLALVDHIVARHHATLRLTDNPHSQASLGLTITICFPATDQH